MHVAPLTGLLALGHVHRDPGHSTPGLANCLALQHSLHLENTTILDVSYHPSPSTVACQGTCQTTANTSAPFCRVQFKTTTSSMSGFTAEAWLPDEWYGRFMSVGNGGLNGCIQYDRLDQGTTLHFATVSSNDGHDGDTAVTFLNNPQVQSDFSHRAVHIQSALGKQIVNQYYGRPHHHSYYVGCSSGGRQGTQAALLHPNDYDGIVAGACALDFNHLLIKAARMARAIGAPNPASSPSYIPLTSWQYVTKEILAQCDALDGIVDGIVSDPDACNFNTERLLCTPVDVATKTPCFTRDQITALNVVYTPTYAPDGTQWYPRFNPTAERAPLVAFSLSGAFPAYASDWMRYMVLNSSATYDASTFGLNEAILMDKVWGDNLATFSGDSHAFNARGGKFIAFHGTADPVVMPGIAKRMYNLVSSTMSMAPSALDSFYRLFMIPSMEHCNGGYKAADEFGQYAVATNKNTTKTHIILAIVDWVEGGNAPDVIVGTMADGVTTRDHCKYPATSMWDAKQAKFVCV
ncbi:tannase and feruloyl esterase, partial [Roridomyces roridus]